jgi:Ca2+-binding EF-hand superfamily protein
MDTAFFQRKMNGRFKDFDRDGDGAISKEDFDLMASQVITGFGVAPDSPHGKEIVDGAETFWNALADAVDTDRDGRLTPEEFAAAATQSLFDAPETFANAVEPWVRAITRTADADGDGRLDAEEYQRMLSAIGAREEDAVRGGVLPLRDGDGSVSVDAVIAAARDFYTSEVASFPNWQEREAQAG